LLVVGEGVFIACGQNKQRKRMGKSKEYELFLTSDFKHIGGNFFEISNY